jgi:hypothetical protein
MKKCKHDYVITKTWYTGFLEQCTKCGRGKTFDVNDNSGANKLILSSIAVGVVLGVINEIFNIL